MTSEPFRDPIFLEINKDEEKQVFKSQVPTHLGTREVIIFPIVTSSLEQSKQVKELVPIPYYPDPMKEPLPAPTFDEVISKPTGKQFESKLIKEFSIWTPK